MPLDDEGLSDVWKVNVVVELRGSPDLSGFDSSVIRGRLFNVLRLFPIPKIELQILQNSGLVPFDREVIMSFSLCDEILGQLALRQQGVGADILALDSNGLQ